MAAAVTNPFKLTWGSYEVGGTTERLIVNLHQVSRSFESWEATFDVLIRGTSDSTFATACSDLESEFSKRRQLILFQVGSSTIHTFNPADGTNTGLNSYARIEKVGTQGADTDRSRLYTVTVGCELPATADSGRRDSPYTIDYLPTRQRVVTFSGTWTASGSNSALAQYQASSAARFSSVLTAIDSGATFEKVSERLDVDDQNKVLRFVTIYKEEIDEQPGAASVDSTSIVDPMLTFARDAQQPGDSGGGRVKRLETFAVRFTCAIDKTVTQDADTLWRNTIKPYVTSQFTTQFRPTSYALVNVRYVLSLYTNAFEADLLIQAAIDATDVIESLITSRIVEEGGKVFTGAWTGGLFDKYVDQGFATRRRFGIRAVRVLGSVGPKQRIGKEGGGIFGVSFSGGGSVDPSGRVESDPVFGGGSPAGSGLPGGQGGGGGSGWHLIANDSAATVKWIGETDGERFAVTDLVETTVEEWAREPGASSLAPGQVGFQGPGGGISIPVGIVG